MIIVVLLIILIIVLVVTTLWKMNQQAEYDKMLDDKVCLIEEYYHANGAIVSRKGGYDEVNNLYWYRFYWNKNGSIYALLEYDSVDDLTIETIDRIKIYSFDESFDSRDGL